MKSREWGGARQRVDPGIAFQLSKEQAFYKSAGNNDSLFSQKYGQSVCSVNDDAGSLSMIWIFESPNLLRSSMRTLVLNGFNSLHKERELATSAEK